MLLLSQLVSCGYDRFGGMDADDFGTNHILPNADLSVLYENYRGEPFYIRENMVFEAYVTSSDETGNFFRSFVVEDVTGAVEIRAGFYDIYNYYQPGRRVLIKAKGLAVGKYNGIMQLGSRINTYSAYRVEEFGTPAYLEDYIVRDTCFKEIKPIKVLITELNEKYCGRLVKIDGLTAEKDNICWSDGADEFTSSGVVAFTDSEGNRIFVTTSAYADFAEDKVPSGIVSLTGILMYGKFIAGQNSYAIKLRGLNDVE